MNKEKYRIKDLHSEEAWLQLVSNSKQGSIFCEKAYLDSTSQDYKRYVIYKGEEVKAGFIAILSNSKKDLILNDLIIYGGIVFNDNCLQKAVKKRAEEYEITEFIVEFITRRFNSIEISMSPGLKDLRAFLWHNYNSTNTSEKFKTSLRYTTYLDISGVNSSIHGLNNTTFNNMETLRRRQIKDAYKDGFKVDYSNNGERLIQFYSELMSKQGEVQEEPKLKAILRIVSTYAKIGRGIVVEIENKDGVVVYCVFYAWDQSKAYYLFGAGNPSYKEAWQGTIAHWEAFKYLESNTEIKIVDLEGVNSPNRGWFKLSMGGELINYFHIQL